MYDYVAGKSDWLAAGLQTEGTNAQHPRAAEVAARDVPTCSRLERLRDVRQRVAEAGWDACVVVNEEGIVLGLLRKAELEGESSSIVEHVMRPGPSTFRPHVLISEMAKRMVEHDTPSTLVTTSDGRLVGLLRREDAVRASEGDR